MRIGLADNVKVDQEVSTAFDRAVATLRSLGHAVKDASAPLTDFAKGIANIEPDRQTIGRLAFKNVDVLVLPTTTTTTPKVKDAANNPLALSAQLTMFANYYGLPAVSVPCGFDRHGLPMGLQIVGRPRDDRAVLQLAWQYERAEGFGKIC